MKPNRPASRLRASDALRVGTIGLRARRGRTALTAIGIAIGIAAMVAVLGISASSRADLLAQIDRLGTNLLAVQPGQSFLGKTATLPKDAPAMIRRIAPVQSASAVAATAASVYRTDKISSLETGGLSVVAAEPNLVSTLNGSIADGTFLNRATQQYRAVVLGANAARTLGIDSTAGNPRVLIARQWFTVIGILDPIALAPSLDASVMVGFPIARELLGADGTASTVYVRANASSLDAVRSVLPATANPQHPNEVQVDRPSDALAARAATNEALTGLLIGLGGVALLVGGVGIANVMVISVLERRSEIGLRRALGATRMHVRVQFVLEAIVLAGIGGIGGIVLGSAITGLYADARGWIVAIPVAGLVGGIACALVIGGLAGLYPAGRAARLTPAEVITQL